MLWYLVYGSYGLPPLGMKHHMALGMLKSIGRLFGLRYNLECNLHIFYFFLYGILPEGITILLVNGIHLVDHLRQLQAKFMSLFKVFSAAFSHHGDNLVPFLQDTMNPPVKHWFIFYTFSYSIFGKVD